MNTKIRQSAKGEACTLNIAGVCNYNKETTVLCHFPSEHNGIGTKSPDYCAGYGCSACHDAIDNRIDAGLTDYEREFYMQRSTVRTIGRLIDKGIISIKGA